jgi:hypothetical protein
MKIEETRPSEFHRVSKWLNSHAEHGRVDIYGISGYGGIGKSFLLRHVLDQIRPISKGFITITLDGLNQSILGDLIGIYDHSLAPRTIPKGKQNYDYFPHARRLAREHSKLARAVNEEIKKVTSADDVKAAAKWIFRGGSFLNKTVPKSKEYVDFESLQKYGVDTRFEEAVDLLARLKPLDSSSWLPGPIKDITGITYRERLKTDLYRLAADEWIADLCAILNRYRKIDKYKLTHSPISGLDRLLLVIDDFEILGKTIIEFVTTALIPALEESNFHTTLIFVGRDDIADAHVAFQHHHSHLVKDKLRLDKFTDDVAQGMFLEAGYSHEELGQLMLESQGYPFLVNLLCEAKGGSVSFYQQFFERTSRWMGPTERNWVLPLCYLERITEGSISQMLPGVSASTVMEWFKHEASLRDPKASWYVIAPYIRRTLIEFHKKEIGTKKSEELVAKGKVASEQA